MGELVPFEVEEDVAAKEAVVEDEIDAEVIIVEGEALLTGLEEEAFTEFQQEGLQLVDDGGFQFVLGVMRVVLQTEELEDERILEQIRGFLDDLPFGSEAADFLLVPAEGEPLVEGTGDLPLKLPHGPLPGGGLDLVKTTLCGVVEGEQFDVVGPAKGERVQQAKHLSLGKRQRAWLRLVRRCRTNRRGLGLWVLE